jgi:hypothetical protein
MNKLNRFSDFKFNSLLESLLLESKLVFSNKLQNLMNSLPESRIKNELLQVIKSGKDLTIAQNFFDIHPEKDKIFFVQDRKAQEILGSEALKYQVNQTHRRLTLNKDSDGNYKNQLIFDELGFDSETMDYVKPNQGQVGEILAQTPSKDTPGKTYVLFKFNGDNYSIYDKEALSVRDDRAEKVWQLTKNPINIGRGIRSILTAAGIQLTDKELEDFVNAYKSSFDIMNDAFLKFDIVSERDIPYWYNHHRYEHGGSSTLGNSCMAGVDSEYFDIYRYNGDVCQLVILYSNVGKLQDGKWVSDKIRGRALLWKTDGGDMFMDRIYTNYDSDIDLFKRFAERNGWWYKVDQDSQTYFQVSNGTQTKNAAYYVTLDEVNFDYYPYVDSLPYLNESDSTISNLRSKAQYEMRDTGGELDSLY